MRLAIRSEQMLVIEAVAEENFVRRIADHLLEQYPKAMVRLPDDKNSTVEELDEETLHSLVRTGIARARSYQLSFESSIAAFTAVMFEVAPNFDTHRLSQVLLNDDEVEPNDRLDELLNVLTEKNWESIREDYDPQAWILKEENGAVEEPQATDEPVGTQKKPDDPDFLETVKI